MHQIEPSNQLTKLVPKISLITDNREPTRTDVIRYVTISTGLAGFLRFELISQEEKYQ